MTRKGWLAVGVIAAVTVLVVAIVAIVSANSGPADYVDDTFARDTSQESDDDTRAYTSDKAPPEVAAMITGKYRPVAKSEDNTGVYLRYEDDAVVIQPKPPGSVIFVMDVDRAHQRYYNHVHTAWFVMTPGGGFRGRGPGSGK